MEYIKNLLKELIGVMFLCTVLYALTPRFVKIIVKSIIKGLYTAICLTIKLVKGTLHIAKPTLKEIWRSTTSEYDLNAKSKGNKKEQRATEKTEAQSDNVIPFSKKIANTKR